MRDDSAMAFAFRPGRSDESPARELLAELIAYFNEIYPGRAAKPARSRRPTRWWRRMASSSSATRTSARWRSAACARSTSRRLRDQAHVRRPRRRSRGAGRALLAALEDAARELGYERVRLDAGPEQRASKVLFARTGYVEIAPYNANHIADYFAEKRP